ncbi:hypothetical protein [Paraburkholderia terrae]|uniref:Uncharacterized protein n=1 Tax=Paraburkholderia terrae TaxID=311230 RepID=A0A2I8EZN2_9BURK|nr:hypothetical protein [Paraburkholderia terrae]AUT65073.1 hypothetical protein C2L65_36460 [Paraburkholderia terrae]
MEATNYLKPATRDEHIARYVTQGLHALCVHSGMRAISEGDEIQIDFAAEIYALSRALELLGVDTSMPIHFSCPDQPPPRE